MAVQTPRGGTGDGPRQRCRGHRARQGPEGGEGAERHRQPGGGLVVREASATDAVALFFFIHSSSFFLMRSLYFYLKMSAKLIFVPFLCEGIFFFIPDGFITMGHFSHYLY